MPAIPNPYLDLFRQLFGDGPISPWVAHVNAGHRELSQRYYSFAVPTPDALNLLARHAPILEMGAGAGYWTSLLRQMGVDVLAYDRAPAENAYSLTHTWTDVLPTPDHAGTIRRHADRTLFLCWPDDGTPFAHECLNAYTDAGGRTFIFAGEERGGCTGDDAFFDLLDQHWQERQRLPLPNWPGLHDSLRIYDRK